MTKPSARSPRKGLLWITNIPTPYTVPTWRELSRLTDLRVACLASSEHNRDWNVDTSDVDVTILNCRRLRIGSEIVLYAPTWKMLSLFAERPRTVVLDGWESPAFWQARLLARLAGTRVVYSYWSTTNSHRFSAGPVAAIRRHLLRTSDGVLTPGRRATEAVLRMGVPGWKITTAFATVDVDHFAEGARRLRKPRVSRGHRYLYVGQLLPRKNIHALISQFSAMADKADSLTVVGSGPLESDLKATVAELDLTQQVHFMGNLRGESLVNAYATSDTLVLPSTEEVWGLVVNEALAAGLSVVVSESCGVADAVVDLPQAFIVKPNANFADALVWAKSQVVPEQVPQPPRGQTPQALASLIHAALELSKEGAEH